MSLTSYFKLYRTPTCLVGLPLFVVVLVVTILVMMTGHLSVVGVPQVDERHRQEAAALLAKNDDTHVLIVGAGAAGLSAAYTLDYIGLPYTLLEGSSTSYGGRVQEMTDFMQPADNLPLDLGAEWIHVEPRILSDLLLYPDDAAAAAEIPIIEFQPQTWGAFVRGRARRRDWARHFSMEYKFQQTTWWSYFAEYWYPYIAENLVMGAVVNRIDYDANMQDTTPIQVTTANGQTFGGTHVIVATPVTILQDKDIDFTPDLPTATWKALIDVEMAPGLKAWLEFDEAIVFPDMQYTGRLLEGESIALYFNALFRKPSDRNVICLFDVNQGSAVERVKLTDAQVVASALRQLEEIFGRDDLETHLLQSRVQNWSNEPFIRGAYSWNHGSYDEDLLREPLYEGRLLLAGEYLAGDQAAMVHGAAISGREVALKILP
jgi:monoamine oxidase